MHTKTPRYIPTAIGIPYTQYKPDIGDYPANMDTKKYRKLLYRCPVCFRYDECDGCNDIDANMPHVCNNCPTTVDMKRVIGNKEYKP